MSDSMAIAATGVLARQPVDTKEVIVIGAGPYGLSAAAHLLDAGAEPYVIGQSMSFWKRSMPGGMLLRSKNEASNIAAPQKHLSIKAYEKAIRRKIADPVPIEDFIAYGEWFQKQVVPNLDTRNVQRLSHDGGVFEITFDDGDKLQAKAVILALGIGPFMNRPEQFADISRELAPHSSDFNEFSRFKGKRVAVLGRGQSALESAALLHEHGAEVQILTRDPALIYRPYAWKKHIFRALTSGPLLPLSYKVIPPTDLGDVWTSRKMAKPELFRRQTPEDQEKLLRACARPIGAYWLEPRLKNVQLKTGVSVSRAAIARTGLRIDLTDGVTDTVDFVVCATGYRIDISKYQIVDSSLRTEDRKDFPGLSSVGCDVADHCSGALHGRSHRREDSWADFTICNRHLQRRSAVSVCSNGKKTMIKETGPMAKTDQDRPGAIILGGNFVGLGIVRSLGARGIPVWVIDADRSKSIAQFSRYTTRFIETKEEITEVLLREGRQHGLAGWVLFPVTDEYVEILSANRDSLSAMYRVTTAPSEVTKFALDKRLTYRRADELGIATPWTSVGDSVAEVEAEGVPYPAILKPAVNHHFFPQTNIKALPIEDRSELERGFAQMSRYIPPDEILVQERIPGGGENQFSYCAVCKDGRAYASLVAQRRRQYPVDFGNASTFVETTSQPVVEEDGRRFLESIGFDGMAEVEFKFDSRDGRYKILDVNPRTWGWHTLGKAAGIDFPYLLWQQAVGLPVVQVEAQHNAAWIREITDIVAIAKSRNRWADVKRLMRVLYRGRFTSATFSVVDPVPFFAELGLWISSGLSRQRKAKAFLQLDPSSSQPERSGEREVSGEARSSGARILSLASVRTANAPVVARFGLGGMAGHTSERDRSEASEGGAGGAIVRPRK